MTLRYKTKLRLCLIALCVATWTHELRADLPVSLVTTSPVPEVPLNQPMSGYWCTSREGAEKLDILARENDSCHVQLKNVTSETDWSSVVLIGAVALLGGFFIGQASR